MQPARASRRGAFRLVGAAIAAGTASACCIGPLLLALVGVGGAGALAKVGGLHDLALAVPAQNALVTYEPAAGRLRAYVVTIDELGNEASLPQPGHRGGESATTRAR